MNHIWNKYDAQLLAEAKVELALYQELLKAAEATLAAFDDNYDASCDDGETWRGGSEMRASDVEGLRVAVAKLRRKL